MNPSDTPKEHDETDYEMIERVFNSDPKLRAALAEKICGPQSDTPRPRTVTKLVDMEQDVERLAVMLCEDRENPCLVCLNTARDFLASLPDAWEITDDMVERAAHSLLESTWRLRLRLWDGESDDPKTRYLVRARAALTAALHREAQ